MRLADSLVTVHSNGRCQETKLTVKKVTLTTVRHKKVIGVIESNMPMVDIDGGEETDNQVCYSQARIKTWDLLSIHVICRFLPYTKMMGILPGTEANNTHDCEKSNQGPQETLLVWLYRFSSIATHRSSIQRMELEFSTSVDPKIHVDEM